MISESKPSNCIEQKCGLDRADVLVLNLKTQHVVTCQNTLPEGKHDIGPISDLKNYTEVLSHCDNGSTVYLTKNGRGKYVVQSLAEHEKLQATVKLLAELAKGVESIRTEGLLTIDEAFAGLDEEKQDPKEA